MDANYSDILISVILATMERKGITRVALADKLGISSQVLGKYLLKKRSFPLDVAMQASKELGIDLNKIIDLKNSDVDLYSYDLYLKFKEQFESSVEEYVRKTNIHD